MTGSKEFYFYWNKVSQRFITLHEKIGNQSTIVTEHYTTPNDRDDNEYSNLIKKTGLEPEPDRV